MDQVPKWVVEVIYNGVNITTDISRRLISFKYRDKNEDESDELDIELEDTDALWRNEWYPEKGAKIFARMGQDRNNMVTCGEFFIDMIKLNGPPDTVFLKCIATQFAKNLRTKKGSSHQKKTLLQIAQYVASNNGFTIVGTIPNITIDRCTQRRETDLHWLRRLASEYGVVFSIRGSQLIFTSMYDLEAAKSVYQIKRTDMIRYEISDQLSGTFTSAQVKYQNPVTKSVVDTQYHVETLMNADGVKYDQLVKDDTLIIRTKTENQTQAKEKAKSALHRANSKQKVGNFRVIGNPLLVSGNNTDVVDMGLLSGKWHILQSEHECNKNEGYITDVDVKAVGTTPAKLNKIKKTKPAPKAKSNTAQTKTPSGGDGITIFADLNSRTVLGGDKTKKEFPF